MALHEKQFEEPRTSLSVPVPVDLLQELRRLCLAHGWLIQDFVADAIREALWTKRSPKGPGRGGSTPQGQR
jgi:hypothetical protein